MWGLSSRFDPERSVIPQTELFTKTHNLRNSIVSVYIVLKRICLNLFRGIVWIKGFCSSKRFETIVDCSNCFRSKFTLILIDDDFVIFSTIYYPKKSRKKNYNWKKIVYYGRHFDALNLCIYLMNA